MIAPVGDLPPVFRPAEIRDAMPVGTQIALRITGVDGPPSNAAWEVVGATDETVTIRYTITDDEGRVLDGPDAREDSWERLSGHAVFPAAHTTKTEERLETPIGLLDTWRYVVRQPTGDKEDRYWFAPSLPGPPVRMISTKGGAETLRVELTRRTQPPAP